MAIALNQFIDAFIQSGPLVRVGGQRFRPTDSHIGRFNVFARRSRQTGIELASNQNQTGLVVSVRGLRLRTQFAQNMQRVWLAQSQQHSFLKRRAAGTPFASMTPSHAFDRFRFWRLAQTGQTRLTTKAGCRYWQCARQIQRQEPGLDAQSKSTALAQCHRRAIGAIAHQF